MQNIKCVCIGDGSVGKTTLLILYTTGQIITDYIPTIFDNYTTNVIVNNTPISICFWDTAGQEDYDRIRPLSYPSTDVFLLCYSIISPSSYNNIKEKWIKEIRTHCPNAKIILVGTKSDLRNNYEIISNLDKQNLKPITYSQGIELKEIINADNFVECSAFLNKNISLLMDQAIDSVINIPNKNKSNFSIFKFFLKNITDF